MATILARALRHVSILCIALPYHVRTYTTHKIIGIVSFIVGVMLVLCYFAPGVLKISQYIVRRAPILFHGCQNVSNYVLCLGLLCVIFFAYINTMRNFYQLIALTAGLSLAATPLLSALSHKLDADSEMASSMSVEILMGLAIPLLAQTVERTLFACWTVVVLEAMWALEIYYIIGLAPMHSGSIARAGGTFDDPNTLCLLLITWIPIGLSIGLAERRMNIRAYLLAPIVICLVALASTWHRVSLPIVLLANFLCFRVDVCKSRFLRAILCCLVTMVVVVGIVRYLPGNHLSSCRAVSGRIVVWHNAISQLPQSMPFGLGVGRLRIDTQPSERSHRVTTTNDAKCVPLTIILELGVYGLLFLLVFVISLSKILISLVGANSAGLRASWISLGLYSFVNSAWGSPSTVLGNVLFGVLLGCTLRPQHRNIALSCGLQS